MAIAKIQNTEIQFRPVYGRDGNLVKGKKISIPMASARLADLLGIDANTEYVLFDFFGAVWVRFDGQAVSAQNGHKFLSDDHPTFAAELIPFITICSGDADNATAAFASQLGSGC